MTVYEWLLNAAWRGWQRYKAEPVAFTAPLFATEAFFQIVSFVVKHSVSGKHLLLDLVVVVLVYFPLCLMAGAINAKLYLLRRQEIAWSAPDLFAVIRSRQLLPLLARFTFMMVLWYSVAVLMAGLISYPPAMWRVFLFGIHHPGLKPAPIHHSKDLFTTLWLLITGIIVSRYTFVMPLFASGRFSAKKAMQSGVKLARGTFVALSLLAVLSLALSYGFGHPMRQLETGPWEKRFAVGLIVLLESSVVYSISAMIGAELAYSKWKDGDVPGKGNS